MPKALGEYEVVRGTCVCCFSVSKEIEQKEEGRGWKRSQRMSKITEFPHENDRRSMEIRELAR